MKEKPVKLDPYLMNHFSLWLPKMFAPIYRRAREIGEKALREAQDARSGKVPSAVNVAINDRRTISDTALSKESTDIFCSHYAHLFIGDFSAWNDLASESPSPLDYLLPRVTELIPQSPLSSDELPRFEALTELSDSEKEVMERQVWPDRKVAERELQDWAHLYTENWENDQSRKEGFQKAEKKWQERNEDLFVGSWWALIFDYRETFIEAMALALGSRQKAHSPESKPAPAPAAREPVEQMASVDPDEDSVEKWIRSKAFHTRMALGERVGMHRGTVAKWATALGVLPYKPIPWGLALKINRREWPAGR